MPTASQTETNENSRESSVTRGDGNTPNGSEHVAQAGLWSQVRTSRPAQSKSDVSYSSG